MTKKPHRHRPTDNPGITVNWQGVKLTMINMFNKIEKKDKQNGWKNFRRKLESINWILKYKISNGYSRTQKCSILN